MEHHGSLGDLETQLKGCGFAITAVEPIEHGHRIRTGEGAIVNWYPSTGKILIQGKPVPKRRLEAAWAAYMGEEDPNEVPIVKEQLHTVGEPVAPSNPTTANKKVFVVHGHDDQSREQLELILHKFGLIPFVLANTGGGGLTIIEALEREIGPREGQARFGIVLLTPDDVGYSRKDGDAKAQPRARQNVVLEMGMLVAAIGRANVAILKKGHLEVPSDAQGILYLPFNDHVKETAPKLADRLRAAGFVLNPQSITSAAS